jgi:hypothetical protein
MKIMPRKSLAFRGGSAGTPWDDWDEAAQAAIKNSFLVMFDSESANDDEIGVGYGLSGADATLTCTSTIPAASGTPPRRYIAGADYFSFAVPIFQILNNATAFTMILKANWHTIGGNNNLLVAEGTNFRLGLQYHTTNKFSGSIIFSDGTYYYGVNSGGTLASTNSLTVDTTYYLCLWYDGTNIRTGFATTKPTKLSDFSSGDYGVQAESGNSLYVSDLSTHNGLTADYGYQATDIDLYYFLLSPTCLIDNNA